MNLSRMASRVVCTSDLRYVRLAGGMALSVAVPARISCTTSSSSISRGIANEERVSLSPSRSFASRPRSMSNLAAAASASAAAASASEAAAAAAASARRAAAASGSASPPSSSPPPSTAAAAPLASTSTLVVSAVFASWPAGVAAAAAVSSPAVTVRLATFDRRAVVRSVSSAPRRASASCATRCDSRWAATVLRRRSRGIRAIVFAWVGVRPLSSDLSTSRSESVDAKSARVSASDSSLSISVACSSGSGGPSTFSSAPPPFARKLPFEGGERTRTSFSCHVSATCW